MILVTIKIYKKTHKVIVENYYEADSLWHRFCQLKHARGLPMGGCIIKEIK